MRRQLSSAVLAVPLVLVLLAGCSAGTDGDPDVASADQGATTSAKPTTSAEPASDPDERMLQFTECLRDHGLNVKDYDPNDPNPFGDLKDVDPKKRQAAMDECQKYAPGGKQGPGLSEEGKAQMLEYVKCLRGQGLEIGDPDPNTGIPPIADLKKIRQGGKDVKKAQEACQDKAPKAVMGK
ncbi:DUF3558 domain-containing protein [Flindersiella endophytica]